MKKKTAPPLPRIFSALEKVKHDSRSLVLITNGYFEVLTDILIRKLCRNGKRIADDRRTYPYASRLVLLNEIGAIEDDFFAILDEFRARRNDAAHETFFEIDGVAYAKRFQFDEYQPGSLYDLCAVLCVLFWSDHRKIFDEAFEKKG